MQAAGTTGLAEQPAFPARQFTTYTRSPRCTGLSGHRHRRDALRASAPTWPQRREVRTTRFRRPPRDPSSCASAPGPWRPSHPALHARDDREAPLSW